MSATPAELDLYLIFVTVAEELSFSKAAQKLKLTKGTISRAIVRLEEKVDAELFYRTTHRVALSEPGRALYEETAAHVHALREVGETLPEHGDELVGALRIAAPHDVGMVILPDLLGRFSARHPRVTLDIRIGNATLDLVREGIDLALRASRGMLEDSSLSMRRIGFGGLLHLYASPDYIARFGKPKRPGDPAHEWASFRGESARSKGAETIPRYRVDDFLLLREIVRSGLAIGILPTFLAEPLERAGEIMKVLPKFAPRAAGGFFLVYPSRRKPSRKVVAFRDVLLESFEAQSSKSR